MKVAIIGGGAAGFFAAIHVAENFPQAQVTILEKTTKVLSKVKVSGGGRCNVCNACTDIDELSKNYPRGSKHLRKAFGYFATRQTMAWFEKRGVELVIQEDQCVFPKSQNSQTIIDCFLDEVKRLKIHVRTGADVLSIEPKPTLHHHEITLAGDEKMHFEKIIITTGGQAKSEKFDWLRRLGHSIESPVPSLFTFNMPGENITTMMGIVVENALVNVQSSKLKANGPLLITHWGMSGPAILKLSAFGARLLAEKKYQFAVQVNWLNIPDENELRLVLQKHLAAGGNKLLSNWRPVEIPVRLWEFLLHKIGVSPDKICSQVNAKEFNRLVVVLSNDAYQVSGKTTFKEEFVTCGGVSLSEVSFKTMQSKLVEGIYFAGEVLDIDGITGGFNFQAAWTTAWLAAKLGNDQ